MGLHLGNHSYVGTYHLKGDMNSVIVGKYCSLANNIVFDCGWSHDGNNISTYPFHTWGLTPNNNVSKGDIIIGNDVWIGEECIIMSGVEIGDGSIIGARSIVSKSVPDYHTVYGNCKSMKPRFTAKQIQQLQELKWWNLPDAKVREIASILHSRDFDKLRGI